MAHSDLAMRATRASDTTGATAIKRCSHEAGDGGNVCLPFHVIVSHLQRGFTGVVSNMTELCFFLWEPRHLWLILCHWGTWLGASLNFCLLLIVSACYWVKICKIHSLYCKCPLPSRIGLSSLFPTSVGMALQSCAAALECQWQLNLTGAAT